MERIMYSVYYSSHEYAKTHSLDTVDRDVALEEVARLTKTSFDCLIECNELTEIEYLEFKNET